MAEQIKKRCEIDAQWKWDLTHIFPSDQAWEEARAAALETIKAFAARQGHVAEDPREPSARFSPSTKGSRKSTNTPFCVRRPITATPWPRASRARP